MGYSYIDFTFTCETGVSCLSFSVSLLLRNLRHPRTVRLQFKVDNWCFMTFFLSLFSTLFSLFPFLIVVVLFATCFWLFFWRFSAVFAPFYLVITLTFWLTHFSFFLPLFLFAVIDIRIEFKMFSHSFITVNCRTINHLIRHPIKGVARGCLCSQLQSGFPSQFFNYARESH